MASKNVSLDEYLHSKGAYGVERKTFANDDGVILKGMPSSAIKRVKYDEASASAAFVMSAEIEDRDRDIVIQAGLDTTNFEANPVALFAHNSSLMIGKWSDLTKSLGGRPKRTEGVLNLSLGIPKADETAILLKSDTLRACSIGFMPTAIERREVPDDKKDDYYYPGYIIHSAELFECSVCAVPANPSALAKAAKEGHRWALEDLERVLDGWGKQHGLLIPRKAFEDGHRQSTGERTMVTFQGKTFAVEAGEGDAPTLVPLKPSKAERVIDALETDEGLLNRLAKALGFKGRTDAADPKPAEDGKKPAPEPTPEEKAAAGIAADLPTLIAKHDLIEADARMAALDAEMGQHAPA